MPSVPPPQYPRHSTHHRSTTPPLTTVLPTAIPVSSQANFPSLLSSIYEANRAPGMLAPQLLLFSVDLEVQYKPPKVPQLAPASPFFWPLLFSHLLSSFQNITPLSLSSPPLSLSLSLTLYSLVLMSFFLMYHYSMYQVPISTQNSL